MQIYVLYNMGYIIQIKYVYKTCEIAQNSNSLTTWTSEYIFTYKYLYIMPKVHHTLSHQYIH